MSAFWNDLWNNLVANPPMQDGAPIGYIPAAPAGNGQAAGPATAYDPRQDPTNPVPYTVAPQDLPNAYAMARRQGNIGAPGDPGPALAGAMAPQPAPAASTPVAAAMNQDQPAPDSAVSNAMSPQPTDFSQFAPQIPQALRDQLNAQATGPGNALANGLLAFGAGMGGAKDFSAGIGAGGQAFGNAYNKTLDNQRDLTTPKVTPFGDGAFAVMQVPGQAPQIVRNDQVAGYNQGLKVLQGTLALKKAQVAAEYKNANSIASQARQNGQSAASDLTTTNAAIQNFNDARTALNGDPNSSDWTRQLAARFPGVAGAANLQGAAKNQLLNNVAGYQTLIMGAAQKGALTNEQASRFTAEIPHTTDGKEVWNKFFDRWGPILGTIQQKNQDMVNAGYEAGNQGLKGLYKPASAAPQGGGSGVLQRSQPITGNGASYIQ